MSDLFRREVSLRVEKGETMIFRQGDILFIKTNKEPKKNMKMADHGRIAEGEVTGHHHSIQKLDLSNVDCFVDGSGEIVTVAVKQDTATVTHQEHGPITLTKGNWEIRRQREYQPEGWRRVAD
jgi:hypothetical protein